MADLLNESQRRMLTSTLMLHEKDLRQADAWLQGIGVEDGILYRRTLRLSAEERTAVRLVIAQALEQIADLTPRQVTVIGIEPARISTGIGVSDAVAHAVGKALEAARRELALSGA